mgnify:CR=1 FL=1
MEGHSNLILSISSLFFGSFVLVVCVDKALKRSSTNYGEWTPWHGQVYFPITDVDTCSTLYYYRTEYKSGKTSLHDIIWLIQDKVLLVADKNDNSLKVVNLVNNLVSTVCEGKVSVSH